MKIGCLGSGIWGFCLGALLSAKGHEVSIWTIVPEQKKQFDLTKKHSSLPNLQVMGKISFTTSLQEAIADADLIFEGVSANGIRPVFEQLRSLEKPGSLCPIVLTSKGIEQNSGNLLSEVVLEVMGENCRSRLGALSGPSIAEEVAQGMPTSVVAAAYNDRVANLIQETFDTPHFCVYTNSDINGVEFGGAMKNIIAIACGVSDGLGYGSNTKASLMTRGLHEIRKLSYVKKCNPETLNGLAGLGDLCVTCLSPLSRNYRFGALMAKGSTKDEALEKIGAVVEGLYSCVSAIQLGRQAGIELPITQAVYDISFKGISPKQAVETLFQKTIKEERL